MGDHDAPGAGQLFSEFIYKLIKDVPKGISVFFEEISVEFVYNIATCVDYGNSTNNCTNKCTYKKSNKCTN